MASIILNKAVIFPSLIDVLFQHHKTSTLQKVTFVRPKLGSGLDEVFERKFGNEIMPEKMTARILSLAEGEAIPFHVHPPEGGKEKIYMSLGGGLVNVYISRGGGIVEVTQLDSNENRFCVIPAGYPHALHCTMVADSDGATGKKCRILVITATQDQEVEWESTAELLLKNAHRNTD